MAKRPSKFENLSSSQFEEFSFELLKRHGWKNVDWRKGTALLGSPADRGRDIVAQLSITEPGGNEYMETWFIDCKHYKRGVPPEKLYGLLAWANAERPDVALCITSGYLSNATKDYLEAYVRNNRPPFRIRYWERKVLEDLLEGHEDLVQRFLTGSSEQ